MVIARGIDPGSRRFPTCSLSGPTDAHMRSLLLSAGLLSTCHALLLQPSAMHARAATPTMSAVINESIDKENPKVASRTRSDPFAAPPRPQLCVPRPRPSSAPPPLLPATPLLRLLPPPLLRLLAAPRASSSPPSTGLLPMGACDLIWSAGGERAQGQRLPVGRPAQGQESRVLPLLEVGYLPALRRGARGTQQGDWRQVSP